MKTYRYTGLVMAVMMIISTVGTYAQTRNSREQPNSRPTVNNNTRSAGSQSNRNMGTVNRNNVQFKKEKTKVVTTRQKPATNVERVVYNNRTYDYYDGRFYVENNGRYMQAPPLRGVHVRVLPAAYTRINFGNNLYFYYQGIYYFQRNGYYEVVNPEIGTIVEALPADYEKVIYNGEMYYEYNGILYIKVNSRLVKGYQVVGYLD